jgi:hypothetical protein
LQDRVSINEFPAELNESLEEHPEQPDERLLEVDNSIFEEPEQPSRCGASIEGIAEFDPMGARLLMLLSKPRPFNNSVRDSILITQIED